MLWPPLPCWMSLKTPREQGLVGMAFYSTTTVRATGLVGRRQSSSCAKALRAFLASFTPPSSWMSFLALTNRPTDTASLGTIGAVSGSLHSDGARPDLVWELHPLSASRTIRGWQTGATRGARAGHEIGGDRVGVAGRPHDGDERWAGRLRRASVVQVWGPPDRCPCCKRAESCLRTCLSPKTNAMSAFETSR